MKLKYNFVIEDVVGQKIAVPIGRENCIGGFLKLNNSGAYILNLLKNDVSAEEIISSIQKDFEVDDITEAKQFVNSFLEELKNSDLLE